MAEIYVCADCPGREFRTLEEWVGHQNEHAVEDGTALVTKTGKILTESDILDLAAEAERGYDLSRITKRPRAARFIDDGDGFHDPNCASLNYPPLERAGKCDCYASRRRGS